MKLQTVVLCAGKGTRMHTEKAKVMHELMGRPMLEYIYNLSVELTDEKPVFVVGHKKEQIINYFGDKAVYVDQEQQLGTGHAIMLAKDKLKDNCNVLITCGDTPLLRAATIKSIVDTVDDKTDAVIVSSFLDEPFGYGRIVKDDEGNFVKIVEQKDATVDELSIKEVNSGIYFIKSDLVRKYIDKLSNDNSQKEYYLTDIFKLLRQDNYNIKTFRIKSQVILGVNTRIQLEQARRTMQARINQRHMEDGVTIINASDVYIEDTVEIGTDTIIYPGNYLSGNTKIGNNCILYPDNEIQNSVIGDNVTIKKSYIEQSTVNDACQIGPYSHLRPEAKLDKNVKVGNFVEIKKASLGEGTKANHLAYVGDGEVGKNVNIGCGVIFVNYDGKRKFKSIVKDNAFIGSNSNLVAPVTVEEKGYVATGSTITEDVPAQSLAVARARQVVKEGWTRKSKLLDK